MLPKTVSSRDTQPSEEKSKKKSMMKYADPGSGYTVRKFPYKIDLHPF